MSSGIFGYVNVLKSAADASWLREEVLSNNIANVDTPNYKRQDVEFKTYLNSAIEQSGKPKATLTQKINNVDLSTENVELAEEQINYNALIDSMNNEFSRFKAVLK